MYLNFYVISRFVCDNIDLFFYAVFLYYFSRNGTRSVSQSDSENSSSEKFFKNYNPTMTMHTTLQDDLAVVDNSQAIIVPNRFSKVYYNSLKSSEFSDFMRPISLKIAGVSNSNYKNTDDQQFSDSSRPVQVTKSQMLYDQKLKSGRSETQDLGVESLSTHSISVRPQRLENTVTLS